MTHSHCTGPTQGRGSGPGNDGLCIMLCTVHTTQGQEQEQETNVFYHTHPVPSPSPVQCV